MQLMDIHTHTNFSDGKDTMEEVIKYAIQKGIKRLGISDHYETIKCHSVCKGELRTYIDTINQLKEKYRDQIHIEAGIELCMDQDLAEIDKFPYEVFNQLDYVLFEYVDDEYASKPLALDQLKAYRDKLTCKVGLAHTDLIAIGERDGLGATIQMLKALDLFWEVNVSYGYADEVLEEDTTNEVKLLMHLLSKYNIPLTAGADNHWSAISYEGRAYEQLIKANQFVEHMNNNKVPISF